MNTYIDCFAGCGGLTDGFQQTGRFIGVAHIEWEKSCRDTLVDRLKYKWGIADAESKVLRFDMQRLDELFNGWNDSEFGVGSGLSRLIGRQNIDLVIGGPPCQAYSLAGRIRDEFGMRYDYRNYLFESYVELIKRTEPDVFVFENVVGVLSASPGGERIIPKIQGAFRAVGYETLPDLRDAIFHMNEFGIPQKRSRVIIVGLKTSTFGKKKSSEVLRRFYGEFRSKNLSEKQSTAREAIGDLPHLYPIRGKRGTDAKPSHAQAPGSKAVSHHNPRFHNARDIAVFRLLAEDLTRGSPKYGNIESLKELYTERTGKVSSVHKYFVIRPNQPSNTIPAHLYKDGLRHIHWDPKQARSITVREAARLQTFDDDFEFLGSVGDHYKMIGNAVPPLFGNKLAIALTSLLDAR